ncbi:MAG: glutamine synthetase [Balneolaceae bacterium]|nr:MAG: glutamine synthetase [Balneolaceae bacterium]
MERDELIQYIRSSKVNKVKYGITDIDGILRGKIISAEKFLKAIRNGFGFCNVIFGWDSNDEIYSREGLTGWHTGYPDSDAAIDLDTGRLIPREPDTPFYLADFEPSEQLSAICPRSLLKRVAMKAETMGINPVFAAEYEWTNFAESHQSLREKNFLPPDPVSPGMFGYSMLRLSNYSAFFNSLFDELQSARIPLAALHTETGEGACEASIEPATILEAADRAVLFKHFVKELAYKNGMIASFMAKWSEDFPGNGAHIHQSLWDADRKKNLFYDPDEPDSISRIMKQYLAGQLHCLPSLLPMYAPTVNSFKRFREGSWASTTVSWGVDNRTTAFRVIHASQKEMRIENRVPGSDLNPYLAMAASLASGLYGIENKLELNIPPTKGNEYEKVEGIRLPGNLREAIREMKRSELPSLFFGWEFADHFIASREWEAEQSEKAVTDWERRRYFEII